MSRLELLIAELCPEGVDHKPLGRVCSIERGKRVTKSMLKQEGAYPVYQNCLTPMGYYEESNCPANTPFIIVGGAAGDIGYSTVEFWAADDCVFITGNADIINRYIFYVLMKNSAYIKSNVRKASIPRLSRSVLERLIIPVPPLPIQREIVKILDNFTELTAELTARQKQYEYYRDLLLTFSDVDNSQNVHVERGGTGRSDG